jgi:hypothetical protein
MGKQSRVDTWIFTAPEYAFAQKQVSLEAVVQVKAALSQITSNYRSLLLLWLLTLYMANSISREQPSFSNWAEVPVYELRTGAPL